MAKRKAKQPHPLRRAEDAVLEVLKLAGRQKPDKIKDDELLNDIWEIHRQAGIAVCALMALRLERSRP